MRALLVLCAALLCLTACATRGDVQVEGGASQVTPPPSSTTLPSGTPVSADAVAVLRADPLIPAKIKAGLVPCDAGNYPIDERYVDLTGDGKAELVVTLVSCELSTRAKPGVVEQSGKYGYPGYAGYVYDLATTPPTRLLAVEDAAIDLVPYTGRRDVVVIRSDWAPRDDPCCPTGQTFTVYRWDGSKMVEVPK